jgi:four helix bundle protein
MDLAERCYRLTEGYPKAEVYGVVSQIRRAAVSVPANIAEGYGREATGSYLHHLRIARGSLRELETLMLLSERIGFASTQDAQSVLSACDELGKMFHGLIRNLQHSE